MGDKSKERAAMTLWRDAKTVEREGVNSSRRETGFAMEGEFEWISTPFTQKSRDTLDEIDDIDKDSTLNKGSCVDSQTLNVAYTEIVADGLDLKTIRDKLVGLTRKRK